MNPGPEQKEGESIHMIYKIRAHHGMCFSFFQGKGYSGEFTENMWSMKEKLSRNPEVILLNETDDVCSRCPNNHAGKCTSADKVDDYDRQVLALCGFREGTKIRWADFEKSVHDNILSQGKRSVICGGCQWNALCL
jgi:hypothetical protein